VLVNTKRNVSLVLSTFAWLALTPLPSTADTTARQIEKFEHNADDAELSREYLGALRDIDAALGVAKSLPPYDEKVSELRARRLRLLLAVKPFSQFALDMSKLIADEKPIEAQLREAEAVVELNNLHTALLEYAIKNDSEPAFKLDLSFCESYRKCNFNPGNVIISFAQFYIRHNDYKPLVDLGKQFNEFRKDPAEFGNYITCLSYEKSGQKKEAREYYAKNVAPMGKGVIAQVDLDVHVARAMTYALQYDEASKLLDKNIATLKHLLDSEEYTRVRALRAEPLRFLAQSYQLKCAVAVAGKNYKLVFESSKAGQRCLDEAFGITSRMSNKDAKDLYKSLQAYEEEGLRAQGKTEQANQLRIERFKRRFGMEIE